MTWETNHFLGIHVIEMFRTFKESLEYIAGIQFISTGKLHR